MNDLWNERKERHFGKLVGVVAGLIFGILILIFGFWRTLFVTLLVIAGFVIGKRFDEKGTFQDLYPKDISAALEE